MSRYNNYEGRYVEIISSHKKNYKEIIGFFGEIINGSDNELGVKIDGFYNEASSKGLYWFKLNEIKFIERKTKMEGYTYVTIVNLLEDYNKKDYAFALYDTEFDDNIINSLVVVNSIGKDNFVLGTVKQIMTIEEYGKSVTAQVIGVVNMDGYIQRENEEKRKKEIKKEKDIIEKELKERLNKLQNIEFYEKMAKEYQNKDPKLIELINKFKLLEEE